MMKASKKSAESVVAEQRAVIDAVVRRTVADFSRAVGEEHCALWMRAVFPGTFNIFAGVDPSSPSSAANPGEVFARVFASESTAALRAALPPHRRRPHAAFRRRGHALADTQVQQFSPLVTPAVMDNMLLNSVLTVPPGGVARLRSTVLPIAVSNVGVAARPRLRFAVRSIHGTQAAKAHKTLDDFYALAKRLRRPLRRLFPKRELRTQERSLAAAVVAVLTQTAPGTGACAAVRLLHEQIADTLEGFLNAVHRQREDEDAAAAPSEGAATPAEVQELREWLGFNSSNSNNVPQEQQQEEQGQQEKKDEDEEETGAPLSGVPPLLEEAARRALLLIAMRDCREAQAQAQAQARREGEETDGGSGSEAGRALACATFYYDGPVRTLVRLLKLRLTLALRLESADATVAPPQAPAHQSAAATAAGATLVQQYVATARSRSSTTELRTLARSQSERERRRGAVLALLRPELERAAAGAWRACVAARAARAPLYASMDAQTLICLLEPYFDALLAVPRLPSTAGTIAAHMHRVVEPAIAAIADTLLAASTAENLPHELRNVVVGRNVFFALLVAATVEDPAAFDRARYAAALRDAVAQCEAFSADTGSLLHDFACAQPTAPLECCIRRILGDSDTAEQQEQLYASAEEEEEDDETLVAGAAATLQHMLMMGGVLARAMPVDGLAEYHGEMMAVRQELAAAGAAGAGAAARLDAAEARLAECWKWLDCGAKLRAWRRCAGQRAAFQHCRPGLMSRSGALALDAVESHIDRLTSVVTGRLWHSTLVFTDAVAHAHAAVAHPTEAEAEAGKGKSSEGSGPAALPPAMREALAALAPWPRTLVEATLLACQTSRIASLEESSVVLASLAASYIAAACYPLVERSLERFCAAELRALAVPDDELGAVVNARAALHACVCDRVAALLLPRTTHWVASLIVGIATTEQDAADVALLVHALPPASAAAPSPAPAAAACGVAGAVGSDDSLSSQSSQSSQSSSLSDTSSEFQRF